MAEQWNVVTVSEMRLLMDKVESSVSLEWHFLRGLEPNEKQMANPKQFTLCVNPYLGDEHFKRKDVESWISYPAGGEYPHYIRVRTDEETGEPYVDVPRVNTDAVKGTSIFQDKNDEMQVEDCREPLQMRYDKKIRMLKTIEPLPETIPEQEPAPNHRFCQLCDRDYTRKEVRVNKEIVTEYESYYEHMISKEHSRKYAVNKDLYMEIDDISDDLNAKFEESCK